MKLKHLRKFPPLWGKFLTRSTPGSKEVHKPHLILRFTSNRLHEVFLVNIDYRRPQHIEHKVSYRFWIMISLEFKA